MFFPLRLATVEDKCFPSGGSDIQTVSLTLFPSSFESMNGFSTESCRKWFSLSQYALFYVV
jgi:hypothetical protein